ncbi:restriction system protein [Halolactibacillus halophilus]|uniref:Restriction system protein n=1 Tax=Halolactibacillus halophilus TaxID=306540 RepID=A0A1I5QWF4_9BACI|nr:restriction endonuclease [Halolactibacillus halophilus]GEM02019.1 hypothetical protein HHA03_15510 [Halolactibacillus halophilus]SFP50599.1 restriction system protein [Halolactibacillus halophilus]
MTKKDKDQLGYSIALIVFLLLIMVRNFFSFIPIMYFIGGALAISFIVGESVKAMIPTKKTKRKSTKNKTKNKETTKKKTNKKATNNAPKKNHNQLRCKKEVMTLPFEKLSWREFERLCYYYYESKGQNPRETGEGADGGIDLIIYNNKDKADEAVQIKMYAKHRQVDVKIIRELNTAKKNHKCMLARLITTSDISLAAMREAGDNRIDTHDGFWVENTLLKWRDQEAKRLKYIK